MVQCLTCHISRFVDRILNQLLCIIFILDLLAYPHNSIRFIISFSNTVLLSKDNVNHVWHQLLFITEWFYATNDCMLFPWGNELAETWSLSILISYTFQFKYKIFVMSTRVEKTQSSCNAFQVIFGIYCIYLNI